MKAWVFTQENRSIEMREVPDPVPGAGEVVVDVEAAGLCHSDIGFIDGTLTNILRRDPIILGHEAAGVISAVGEGVTNVKIGDRVAISASGADRNAQGVEGTTTIEVGRDGGYAEKTLSPADELIPLAHEVSFEQAAAASDAGQTVHHALYARGDIRDLADVGLELIVDFAGFGTTTAGAVEVAANRGRTVQVGLGRAESTVSTG